MTYNTSELPPETKTVIAETVGHEMRRYIKPTHYDLVVVSAAMMVRRQPIDTLQCGRGTHTHKSIVVQTIVDTLTRWHTHCGSLAASLVGTRTYDTKEARLRKQQVGAHQILFIPTHVAIL